MIDISRSMCVVAVAAVAAAPAFSQNDECSTALPLTLGSVAFNTTTATQSNTLWPCAGGGGPDLWYEFTAANTNPVRFETCGSTYDTAIEAFRGTCTSLVSVLCNDDACALQSSIVVIPNAVGEVLYVRVGGFSGLSGSGTLTATELLPQANDECSSASVATTGATQWSTVGALASAEPWSCGPISSIDVWFVYTAQSTDTLGFSFDASSISFAQIHSGSCGALMVEACEPVIPGQAVELTATPSAAGDPIYIRIGSLGATGSSGDLTIREIPAPPNDDCAGALALVRGIPEAFDTLAARHSAMPFACAPNIGPDLWYSYTASASGGMLRVETCGSALDTVLEAFEGTCGNLTPIACNDRYCANQSRINVMNVTAGTTYVFRVGGYGNTVGEGSIVVAEVEPPVQGCVVNPGFETGDFAGWALTDFQSPAIPTEVGFAGRTNSAAGFFVSAPTEGKFSLTHGFSAVGPDTLVLSQDLTVAGGITPLTFDWRAAWDLSFIGATMDRRFDVVVRDPSTGAALQSTNILTAAAGTMMLDTGPRQAVVSLAMFAGQHVRVSLEWHVPETPFYPAFFELDNLLCPAEGGPIGVRYCSPAVSNSTGQSGVIGVSGSAEAALNAVTLTASDLPQHSFGFFLTSRDQGSVIPSGSLGTLCLGGAIGRYSAPGQVMPTGTAGEITLALDLTMTPTPTGLVSIAPGETWNFQAWYRDLVLAFPTSNLTDAFEVTFY